METVTGVSSVKCLAKSPNGHNRLTMTAEPLSLNIVHDLGAYKMEEMRQRLVKEYQWDNQEVKKIWCFGPEEQPLDILVDQTRGIQYMNEVRDNVVTSFKAVMRKGMLAEEPIRGVKFNLLDAVLHSDVIHRGAGQIVPAARRSLLACQYTAQPRFMEPMFLVDIMCPNKVISGVDYALRARRGEIIESAPKQGNSNLMNVKAYLPVAESFGFASVLRENTSGQAFPQLVFDHWRMLEDDPLIEGSKSNLMAKKIRQQKGIETTIAPLERYLDKL